MRKIGLEIPQYFYPLMENTFGCYQLLVPSLVSLLSKDTVQPKNVYFDLLGVTGQA